MFKMENKYDVVETGLLGGEFDGSLLDVQNVAGADLENGRIVVLNEDGVYEYAKDSTNPEVHLLASVEVSYTGAPIDEFINLKGEKIRTYKLTNGARFGTTAVPAEVETGAKLTVGADGKLVAGADEDILFVVEKLKLLGNEMGAVVRKIK